jgi:hypothetical protein
VLQSCAPDKVLHADTALPPAIAKILPLATTGEKSALSSDVSMML